MIPFKLIKRSHVKKPLSLRTFDKEIAISQHIAISHFVTPNIFSTKNSELGVILKIQGIPFETICHDDINYLQSSLAFLIKTLGDEYAVYTTTYRHQSSVILNGKYPEGFCSDFIKTYNNKEKAQELFNNDIYLTILLKSGSTKVKKSLSFLQRLSMKHVKDEQELFIKDQIKKLNNKIANILTTLSDYSPSVLGIKNPDDNIEYSEVLSFLSIFVNGEYIENILFPFENIATLIPLKRLFFGNNAIHFQSNNSSQDKFAAIISIKKYHPQQVPGLLNGLLSLPFEYILTHSYLGIDKAHAHEFIRRQEARLIAVGDHSKSQITELDTANDDLASDRITLGYHHNTLLILANSIQELDDRVAKAIRVYSDVGILAIRETLNLESAFWAQIPGNFSMIRRSSLISSNNFSCFSSLHNYYSGYINKNHLGGALMLAQTRSRTPFYLNLHEKASGKKNDLSKGHTTIIGSTGAGKTVLMMTIDIFFNKYGIKSFIFDRNRGCDIYVRAMGGNYFLLNPQEATCLNPCQLSDTPSNRAFLRDFLKQLIYRPNLILNASDENQISEVVDRNFTLPFEKRTLSNISSFFKHDFAGLDALSKWLKLPDRSGKSGEYAYLFDNAQDSLNLNAKTIGFDMTYILGAEGDDKKDILTPVMMYLFHRIQNSLNGQLTGVYLDEGWQFLNNAYWVKKLDEYLVTWRKLNAFIVFATQLPDKVAKSPLASSLIQGSATNIFLPNPKAQKQDYIEGFKLTSKEFEIIKNTTMQSRYFLIKQGFDTAVIKLDLSNMDKYLAILSGNNQTVELCENLRKSYGEDPDCWLPHFYERYSNL